ncbi:hypothetical protein WOC76_09345 [Methylocystis sp. IM3]|uniref:hypothetical protein n=1 Tax=unclassified Methylocystis TaxID=2625913 RepID=UPI0030F6F498
MGWWEDLKKNRPNVVTVKSTLAGKTASKTPAEKVVEYLQNSLNYLADPKFKVTKKGGDKAAPELCYAEKNGQFYVHAKYGRAMLELVGEDKFVVTDKAGVKEVIEFIIAGLKAGEFDQQLAKLQEKRKKGNGD